MAYILSYSRNERLQAARSCRLLHTQRQIRYGVRVVPAAIPNWASSGHLRGCSAGDTSTKIMSS